MGGPSFREPCRSPGGSVAPAWPGTVVRVHARGITAAVAGELVDGWGIEIRPGRPLRPHRREAAPRLGHARIAGEAAPRLGHARIA
ncbi:hypothetical protein AB0N16_37810, partial [Streptomyces sp. NPDC051105]|uniref:hypothetical protein n=1 Tax=Streptomyces sp. NPDC051105 TaxID=3154843 RepID=UPI00341EA383